VITLANAYRARESLHSQLLGWLFVKVPCPSARRFSKKKKNGTKINTCLAGSNYQTTGVKMKTICF
jgi:hypothetical protein